MYNYLKYNRIANSNARIIEKYKYLKKKSKIEDSQNFFFLFMHTGGQKEFWQKKKH